jgi:hypothetical protein
MTGRSIQRSIKYREWIEKALDAGEDSPSRVLEWIEQRKAKGEETPALPTVSRIMKDMGYKPTGIRWEKDGK